MFFVEISRNLDIDFYHLVTAVRPLQTLNALSAKSEYSAGLRSCGNRVAYRAVYRGNFNLRTKSRLQICYRNINPDIVILALKYGVLPYGNADIEVAPRTAVCADIALSAHCQRHSVADTGGNIYRYRLFLGHSSAAAALWAGAFDNLALASALCACACTLHCAEHRLLTVNHFTRAVALAAGLNLRAFLCARTAALVALLAAVDFNIMRHALAGFHKAYA